MLSYDKVVLANSSCFEASDRNVIDLPQCLLHHTGIYGCLSFLSK